MNPQQQMQMQLPAPQKQEQKQTTIKIGNYNLGSKTLENYKKTTYFYGTGKKTPKNFDLNTIGVYENCYGSLIFTLGNRLTPLNILTEEEWQIDKRVPYITGGRKARKFKENAGLSEKFTKTIKDSYEENKLNETEDELETIDIKKLVNKKIIKPYFKENEHIKNNRIYNNRGDVYDSRKIEATIGTNISPDDEFELYKFLSNKGRELREYNENYDYPYL